MTLRYESCGGTDARTMEVGTGPELMAGAVAVTFEEGMAEIRDAGKELRVAVAAELADSGVYVMTKDPVAAPVGA